MPAVDLVRTKQPSRKKRELEFLRNKVIEVDPDWWKPLTDEEAEAFLEDVIRNCRKW